MIIDHVKYVNWPINLVLTFTRNQTQESISSPHISAYKDANCKSVSDLLWCLNFHSHRRALISNLNCCCALIFWMHVHVWIKGCNLYLMLELTDSDAETFHSGCMSLFYCHVRQTAYDFLNYSCQQLPLDYSCVTCACLGNRNVFSLQLCGFPTEWHTPALQSECSPV